MGGIRSRGGGPLLSYNEMNEPIVYYGKHHLNEEDPMADIGSRADV